jgi:hypothetical protein
MTWEVWCRWLGLYGLAVGLDIAYAVGLYAEHGCVLPYTALLSDHSDLELKVNLRTSQNPEIHPELVSDAISDASLPRRYRVRVCRSRC